MTRQGPWGKGSREITNLSPALKMELKTAEGEWWMAYTDFITIFTSLSMVAPVPEERKEVVVGAWPGRKEEEDVQYRLDVVKPGMLRLALIQKRDEMHEPSIKLTLVKLPRKRGRMVVGEQVGDLVEEVRAARTRTVISMKHDVTPGHYLLVLERQGGVRPAPFCLMVEGSTKVKDLH